MTRLPPPKAGDGWSAGLHRLFAEAAISTSARKGSAATAQLQDHALPAPARQRAGLRPTISIASEVTWIADRPVVDERRHRRQGESSSRTR